MKKLAARDFEDILQVRTCSADKFSYVLMPVPVWPVFHSGIQRSSP